MWKWRNHSIFILFILFFCHFNPDSGFIFSSLLISRAEEESWSQSKVEKRVILSNSTPTITWKVLSERDLTPDSLSTRVFVQGHQGGDRALKGWVLRGKAQEHSKGLQKDPGTGQVGVRGEKARPSALTLEGGLGSVHSRLLGRL